MPCPFNYSASARVEIGPNKFIDIITNFNIVEDYETVTELGLMKIKKVNEIEIYNQVAVDASTGESFEITKDDISWFKSEINESIEKTAMFYIKQ